jgi:hypothetical protein
MIQSQQLGQLLLGQVAQIGPQLQMLVTEKNFLNLLLAWLQDNYVVLLRIYEPTPIGSSSSQKENTPPLQEWRPLLGPSQKQKTGLWKAYRAKLQDEG